MTTKTVKQPRRIAKPAVEPVCEACCDLKFVPDFVASIITTNNISVSQVQSWWHTRGHTIFKNK